MGFSVIGIKRHWVRRLVLAVVFIPTVVACVAIEAALGAIEETRGIVDEWRYVWRGREEPDA